MNLRRGSNAAFKHWVRNGTAFKALYRGLNLRWRNVTPPVIASFTATPANFRIDQRATGNIRFDFNVTNATKVELLDNLGNKLWAGIAGPAVSSEYTNLTFVRGRYDVPGSADGKVLTTIILHSISTKGSVQCTVTPAALYIDGNKYELTPEFYGPTRIPNSYVTTTNIPVNFRANGFRTIRYTRRLKLELADGRLVNINTGVPFTPSPGGVPNNTTIPQPTKTTPYTLTAFNDTGSSSRRTTVTVNRLANIESFVSDGAIHGRTGGTTFRFRGVVVGNPKPTLSADQGIGTITDRHLTPRSDGKYDLLFTHFFGVAGSRTITLTATNSFGSNTAQTTVQVP